MKKNIDMKEKLHNIILFRPFDETNDLDKKESLNSPFRVFLIISVLVLGSCGFIGAILYPNSNTTLALIALAVSLKAIQVIIEWHLGLKAMAKNSLFLVIVMTIFIMILRNL
ncbi:hypothetical protein [Acinetobacter baumannii]|uniref:hypothetical protein n=1 Tax=Acinetobacter baumannii TaxID=470 RepID=UPI0023419190|nr:hypothetical protein [Acinetobacter baumannii]MDC4147567.1 hypothetical protein [Acinetobacter baumannii]